MQQGTHSSDKPTFENHLNDLMEQNERWGSTDSKTVYHKFHFFPRICLPMIMIVGYEELSGRERLFQIIASNGSATGFLPILQLYLLCFYPALPLENIPAPITVAVLKTAVWSAVIMCTFVLWKDSCCFPCTFKLLLKSQVQLQRPEFCSLSLHLSLFLLTPLLSLLCSKAFLLDPGAGQIWRFSPGRSPWNKTNVCSIRNPLICRHSSCFSAPGVILKA